MQSKSYLYTYIKFPSTIIKKKYVALVSTSPHNLGYMSLPFQPLCVVPFLSARIPKPFILPVLADTVSNMVWSTCWNGKSILLNQRNKDGGNPE